MAIFATFFMSLKRSIFSAQPEKGQGISSKLSIMVLGEENAPERRMPGFTFHLVVT